MSTLPEVKPAAYPAFLDKENSQALAAVKVLRGLTGATILGADLDVEDLFPQLQVRLADGSRVVVTISSDPEGNGPGFAFVEEVR